VRRIAATVAVLAALAALPAAAAAGEPRGWRPDVAAARAYAAGRQGEVAFAVRTRHRHWSYRADATYRSASVVKAMLLVAYLRRADVRGRALRAGERALLDPMIRRSDNRAADAVMRRVGTGRLAALGRRAGMRHFAPYPVYWGGSTITAADQARLFLRIDRLVPRRHRAYAMGLLRTVIPGQRWGIAAAVPHGWTIAFKGGWGRGQTRQVDHQAALLTRDRERVAVAILTADNPSNGYGFASIEGVAERLLRGLERRVVGAVHPGRAHIRRAISGTLASWPTLFIASSSSTSTAPW
jgi:beta-lactamase class A